VPVISKQYKYIAEEVLGFAGVKINGSNPWDITVLARFFTARLFNLQTSKRAFMIGEKHYDLVN